MAADVQILARTIYGEARGEYNKLQGGLAALMAVGNVVMNRLQQDSWYGATVQEVCQKPWQFSCWNIRDANFKLLQPEIIMDPNFSICLEVAERIISGQWPDLTAGADHYHTVTMPIIPRWAEGIKPKRQIGQHLFYDLRRK